MDQRVFVSLCFFLSGVSALVYEVVWARMLITIFGASLYAVATTTSLFLGGLALGAFLGGRFLRGDATQRLKLYATLEAVVAVLGALLPYLLGSAWLPQTWAYMETTIAAEAISYLLRFLISAVILLPPTMLMGATLPVLVGVFPKQPPEVPRDPAQLLYAVNTTGGAVGALLAGFVLIPGLGLRATSLVAAALNFLAAVGAMLAVKAKPVPEPVVPAAPPNKFSSPPPPLGQTATVYSVAFLSGVILLTLEVCWTRWFSLILGPSIYSLSCVLAIFLLSLSAGAWVAERTLQRLRNGLLFMSTAYFLSCTYILITLYAANELPWTFLAMTQFASSIFGGYTFAASLFARVVVIALLIAVPTFLLGIIMPLVLGAQADDKPEFVGRAYGMNIAGSICGALITGFTLIPALSAVAQTGIRWTLIISLIAQILIAMWLFIEWSRSFVADPDTRNIVIGIVIFVASAVIIDVALFRPEWNRTIASAGASFFTPEDIKKLDKESFLATIGAPEGEDSVRFYREGLNATVTVGQDENRNVTFLKTDGKVEAAIPTNPVEAAKGADTTTHMLLGALPPALVSGGQLHGLVIGYGSGTTSGAALVDPRVVTLDIAELERAVYAADQFFAQSNGNPLAQAGRVHKLVNDGRYILGSSYSAYDFIVCQPSDPWVSGASELFTLDFWQLAKAHLKPNGVIAQWVQMYSIHPQEFLRLCATFAHVYPNSVIVHPAQGGECVMLGFNSAEPITPEKIRNSLRTESTTAKFIPSGYRLLSDVLRSATIVDPAGVKAMTTVEPPLALNTDDRNRIEFAAARGAMTQRQNIADNVQMLQKHAATPMLSR